MSSSPINHQAIKVTFDNGREIYTLINGTHQEIEAYYLQNWFNIGNGELDLMARAVSVEFID